MHSFKNASLNIAVTIPKLLSTVKLPILIDVPSRLHADYVGITLLTLNATHTKLAK